MSISYLEPRSFACSVCGAKLEAEVWLILDAAEHPAQLETLHQGTLNRTTCPQCGSSEGERWPFLFHDRTRRCLLLALPPGDAAEHRWRDQVRDLHARLLAHTPPEQRWAYQGEVQVVQGVAGIGHALKKRDHQQSWRNMPNQPDQPESERENHARSITRVPEPSPYSRLSVHHSGLSAAIQALIGADSFDEFRAIVEHYPVLLEPETDQALKELADAMFEQREYQIASCLAHSRRLLAERCTGGPSLSSRNPGEGERSHEPDPEHADIPEGIYAALAQTRSLEELRHLVQQHPLLLETRMDALFDQQIDRVLDEGNERLALILQHRYEQIIELRKKTQNGLNYDQTHASVSIT